MQTKLCGYHVGTAPTTDPIGRQDSHVIIHSAADRLRMVLIVDK